MQRVSSYFISLQNALWKGLKGHVERVTGSCSLCLKEAGDVKKWILPGIPKNLLSKISFFKSRRKPGLGRCEAFDFIHPTCVECQPAPYISGCNKGHRKGRIIFKARRRSLNTFSIRWLMKMGTPFARVRVTWGTIKLIWRSVHMRACAPCRSGLASN